MREAQAWQLMVDGRTQLDIARTIGVSQPAVSKMLRRLEERFLADQAFRIERQRARHTARLEHVYRQALEAWAASQTDTVRRRQRKTEGGAGAGTLSSEIVSAKQHGDPRYLEVARRALADLRAVWGVNAPEALRVEGTDAYTHLSDEALRAAIAKRHEELFAQPKPVSSSREATDADR
jgi:DNA-binding transcriptional LysR family regulator